MIYRCPIMCMNNTQCFHSSCSILVWQHFKWSWTHERGRHPGEERTKTPGKSTGETEKKKQLEKWGKLANNFTYFSHSSCNRSYKLQKPNWLCGWMCDAFLFCLGRREAKVEEISNLLARLHPLYLQLRIQQSKTNSETDPWQNQTAITFEYLRL